MATLPVFEQPNPANSAFRTPHSAFAKFAIRNLYCLIRAVVLKTYLKRVASP